jgi:RNA polymerase sigma-70 factor (ECF subfamily)
LLTLTRDPTSINSRRAQRHGVDVTVQTEMQSSLLARASHSPAASASADDSLVAAAQKGDRSAFGRLYARYARMVHGILLTRVPHSSVEDLVQDVFLKALPRLNSLRDISHFGGWLAAIARNCAADFHRQSKPDVTFEEDLHAGVKNASGPDAQDRSEALLVLEAIRSLPETYRETLMLRLVEGMTGPEIAAHTGLTHGSVRVNLHRGMQQLREVLAHKARASGLATDAR